jgi:PAS domain S-box-containing protein
MEEKKLELKENHSLGWQETFDAAMDIFALISEDFEILKLNKAGCENLGKQFEEIVGMKCYKVVHGLNEPIENCPCKKMLETGRNAASEIIDHNRSYMATASPIFDENKKFMAFAHTIKDITGIKNTEKSLKDLLNSLEQKVEERTSELVNINKKLSREFQEHTKSRNALKKSEILLQKQKKSLEQKNAALKEVISQIEIEKNNIKEEINCNVDLILLPILERLKFEEEADNSHKLLRHHLKKLTSSYGNNIKKLIDKLTPREIEICNMIKADLSSKEISSILNISITTVNKHRRNIRQKLDINNKNINLSSLLKKL